ncbi:MAG: carboxypeptidase-like regulatory domain-containing protein [Flavobacteriales bacterium]|nr:carboxypeptidase-like regulatory domain-containing protein [Flavobacteriales bacterium]
MTNFLKIFFAFLLLFSSQNSFAQEKKVEGVVKIVSQEKIPINIINLRSKKGTTNRQDGYFEISAKAGDTLRFSAVNLQNQDLIILEENFKGILEVLLFPKNFELNEVVLSEGFSMYRKHFGDDDDAAKAIKNLDLPWDTGPINKTYEERELSYAGSSLIANVFMGGSQYVKDMKKLHMLKNQSSELESVRVHFGDSLFSKMNILPKDINRFIYFCSTEPLFNHLLKIKDYYQMVLFMQSKTPAFFSLIKEEEIDRELGFN